MILNYYLLLNSVDKEDTWYNEENSLVVILRVHLLAKGWQHFVSSFSLLQLRKIFVCGDHKGRLATGIISLCMP
jgi:hypothetical protein